MTYGYYTIINMNKIKSPLISFLNKSSALSRTQVSSTPYIHTIVIATDNIAYLLFQQASSILHPYRERFSKQSFVLLTRDTPGSRSEIKVGCRDNTWLGRVT